MNDSIEISIDGKIYQANVMENLQSLLQRLEKKTFGLCYYDKILPRGQCDLCVVRVNGKLARACEIYVRDQLKIELEHEDVKDFRTDSFKFLSSHHHTDCEKCHKSGHCQLQDFSRSHPQSLLDSRHDEEFNVPVEKLGENFLLDHKRCIGCSLCVDYSQNVARDNVFYHYSTQYPVRVGVNPDQPVNWSVYRDLCPSGAIKHDRDHRMGERSDEGTVQCVGCDSACLLNAKKINDQFISIRTSEQFLGTVCDDAFNWWHSIDLKNKLGELAVSFEIDDIFVPATCDELKPLLSKARYWQVALPGDLSQEEANFWHDQRKNLPIDCYFYDALSEHKRFFKNKENYFIQSKNLSELEIRTLDQSLKGDGLIFVDMFGQIDASFIRQLSQNYDLVVLVTATPWSHGFKGIQVERFSWFYSELLPTGQSSSLSGIMDLLKFKDE